MKKVVLIFCLLASHTAWGWADDPLKPIILPNISHTVLGAVVKTVSWADPVKGTKSEIVVIDAAKKNIHILVTSNTTLWDSEAKAIMPDRIVAHSRINVIYLTTPEGINVGKSIKVLK